MSASGRKKIAHRSTGYYGDESKARLEPRSEKTGLRGFRPGPTQTKLYDHTRWLEA